jgi:serine/threonine protein phosphatase PrpC
MKLGVTYKKNDDGSVGLLVGNIGTDVYIPDSAFALLPFLRKKLGRNACLFPLFFDEGCKLRIDIGKIKGESVSLSDFSDLTAGGLTRKTECENFKARLNTIKLAIDQSERALQKLLTQDEADEPAVCFPSPYAAPDLYRYAETADGGYCFIVLGVERIGESYGVASVAELIQYFDQMAEKIDILKNEIDLCIKALKPSFGGKIRDIFGGKKAETAVATGFQSISDCPVWDILDGKRSAVPVAEPVMPSVDDPPSPPVDEPKTAQSAEPPAAAQPAEEPAAVVQPTVEPPAVVQPVTEPPAVVQPEVKPPVVVQPAAEPPAVVQPEAKPPVVQPQPSPIVTADEGWKSIPSDQQARYAKPDSATKFLACGNVSIVAASLRGRSHALKGEFREDDFHIHYDPGTRCAFLAVADGAGSAKYSRKGSEIAVRVAVKEASVALCAEYWKETERTVRKWYEDNGEVDRKNLGIKLYPLIQAAFKARTAIVQEAGQQNAKEKGGIKVKDFATTLILAIVKEFEFGFFVATYWVGDGGVCVYKQDGRQVTVMGEPDSGDHAGETRFLTTSGVWPGDAQALIDRRLHYRVFKSFKAVTLMTDGVSDAKFGGDASFANFSCWDAFWKDIASAVPFDRRDDSTADALLKWLDFQVKGEFDDRTLVVLY